MRMHQPGSNRKNAVSPSNKAIDYGNAFVNTIKADPGKNSVVTSSSVVANGSDAALMTVVLTNKHTQFFKSDMAEWNGCDLRVQH